MALNVNHTWRHNTRVSINVVAARGAFIRTAFDALAKHSQFPLPDEPLLSYNVPHTQGWPSTVIMACVVVHLHFGPQTEAVQRAGIYEKIAQLLDDEGAPCAPSQADTQGAAWRAQACGRETVV